MLFFLLVGWSGVKVSKSVSKYGGGGGELSWIYFLYISLCLLLWLALEWRSSIYECNTKLRSVLLSY